jgi:hypothetical protein
VNGAAMRRWFRESRIAIGSFLHDFAELLFISTEGR